MSAMMDSWTIAVEGYKQVLKRRTVLQVLRAGYTLFAEDADDPDAVCGGMFFDGR
jgi:hypothetical protein